METFIILILFLCWQIRWWIALFIAVWIINLVYEDSDRRSKLARAEKLIGQHALGIRTCGCPKWMGAKGFEGRHILPLPSACEKELLLRVGLEKYRGTIRNKAS